MPNTNVNYGVKSEQLKGTDRELYATQSWKHSYEGDGPFYQMAFMHLTEAPTQDRTWSQQQIFPVELTLQTINGEVRLCRNPVNAIKQLRYDAHFWKDEIIRPAENPLSEIHGDVFEIIAEIHPMNASQFGFDIRGERLIYSVDNQSLTFMGSDAPLLPMDGKIRLRMIIDRNSVEVYANQGEVTFTKLFYPDPSNMNLEFFTKGGSARIESMEIYRLMSIWLKREQELGYYRDGVKK